MPIFLVITSFANFSLQNLDLGDLHNIIPSWRGKQYPECIPDEVCQEILQELCTISFKLDVGMADCYLYRLRPVGFNSIELKEGEATMFNELDASTHEEQHVKVASFLPGFTREGDTDFSSRDVAKRRVAMYRLYCIAQLGWNVRHASKYSSVC